MLLTGLDRVLRDAKVPYREEPGWKSRTGRSGGVALPKGILWHHTATPAASVKAKNNPTRNYVRDGLGYPLCQLLLAWDGSVDIIAAGWCAHAGKGVYPGIARDTGNDVLIGIEVEGTIGLPWSAAQLESAARIGAAFDAEFGKLIHIGHYEWAPVRKTDPSGIPGNMPALRQAITRGTWTGLSPVTSKPIPTLTKPNPKPVVIVTPPKEPTLSASEVLDIKSHIDAALKAVNAHTSKAADNLRADLPKLAAKGVWLDTQYPSRAPGSDPKAKHSMAAHTLATNGKVYALEDAVEKLIGTTTAILADHTLTAEQIREQIGQAFSGLRLELVPATATEEASA